MSRQKQRFLDTIKSSSVLYLIEETDEGCGIENRVTGVCYQMVWEALANKQNFKAIMDTLHGKREARPLRHMSRVCGYFSQIENWNKSKLGELRLRKAGQYKLPNVVQKAPSCSKKLEPCEV